MQLRELVKILDRLVPPSLAEDWDNVGFLVGDGEKEVHRALVVLDLAPQTLDQAREEEVDLILAHHPAIFRPLKAVRSHGPSRLVFQLIEMGMAFYCAHTNLDVVMGGVADLLAAEYGLEKLKPLRGGKDRSKYHFYLHLDKKSKSVENKLDDLAGAGVVESHQKFDMGKVTRYEGQVPFYQLGELKRTLSKYGDKLRVFSVEGKSQEGLGRVGSLPKTMTGQELVDLTKEKLGTDHLRYVGDLKKKIKRVALLPGSGGGYVHRAASAGADAYITADLKHHDALEAQEIDLFTIDPGHFGTERCMIAGWADMIRRVCPDLELIESDVSTDPFSFA